MSLNKALSALLVVVFVIVGLAIILTWSVESNALNADAYVQTLAEAGFFDVPYQLIHGGDIPKVGALLLIQGPLSIVSGDDLEAVARELAPPNWMRAQLERAIRDLVGVANASETSQPPDFVISLSEVKARALGEPGNRALLIIVDILPDCASDQIPFAANADIPVCRPTGADLNAFVSELKTLLTPLVNRVPDTYRVSWQQEQRNVLEELRQANRILNQLKLALLFLVALNIALLGLIWLLAVRSPAEWLRWTGVPLLLVGLLALILGWLVPQAVTWGLDSQTLWAERNVPTPLAHALQEAIRDFIVLLFRPARLAGVALSSVGFLLALVSLLFPDQ